MDAESPRFGRVEYTEEQVITFPEGLLGFADLRSFLHLAPEDTSPVEYLLSLDEPRLCFPLINPYIVRNDYVLELGQADREGLALGEKASLAIHCVATLCGDAKSSTINLLAPVVINPDARLGRQVVIEGSGYGVSEPLRSEA